MPKLWTQLKIQLWTQLRQLRTRFMEHEVCRGGNMCHSLTDPITKRPKQALKTTVDCEAVHKCGRPYKRFSQTEVNTGEYCFSDQPSERYRWPSKNRYKQESRKLQKDEKRNNGTRGAAGNLNAFCRGHGSNRKIEGSALSNLNIIGEENDIIHNTTASQGNPLFFFYDSEATGGSVYTEHIIEMAAVVSVPEGVSVTKSAMSSLLGTSKGINSRVQKKRGLKLENLKRQPTLSAFLPRFCEWIEDTTKEVCIQSRQQFFPVLVAHNGRVFDFDILFAEIERRNGLSCDLMRRINLHFADTLPFLRELQKSGLEILHKMQISDKEEPRASEEYKEIVKMKWKKDKKEKTAQTSIKIKLGLPDLYKHLVGRKNYNAHTALGDARALRAVLATKQLQNNLGKLKISNVDEELRRWTSRLMKYKRHRKLTHRLQSSANLNTLNRLAEADVSYEVLQSMASNCNQKEFTTKLRALGVNSRKQAESIYNHLHRRQKP